MRGFEAFLRRASDSLLHGVTPLMHAAEDNDVATIKQLLAKGVDVDGQNKHGWTALMLATTRGNQDAVDLLLKAGANPNLISQRVTGNTQAPTPQTTALAEALKGEHLQIAHSLLANQASADPIAVAIAGGVEDLEMLKQLKDAGAKFEEQSGVMYYPSAMVMACMKGRLENVQFLLEAGVKPHYQSLASAVGHDQFEIVQGLVPLNNNKKYFSSDDLSMAMWWAATKKNTKAENYPRNLKIIKYLLDAGADKDFVPVDNRHRRQTAMTVLKSQSESAQKRIERNSRGQGQQSWDLGRQMHREAVMELIK